MTDDQSTRRSYLRRVGSLAVAGVLPRTRTADAATTAEARTTASPDADPSQFLLKPADVPPAFEPVENSDEVPFFTALRNADPQFADAVTGVTGYWTGSSQTNPRWVVSSVACVGTHEPEFASIETAATQCHDTLAAAYADGYPPSIDVTQTHQVGSDRGTWRIDLQLPLHGDDSDVSPTTIATDLLYLRLQDNILLGTVVFGPASGTPSPDTRLDRYATLQATRLAHWRNT